MPEKVSAKELADLMEQFCGTEQYYRLTSCLITDGMKAVADRAGAYWLAEDIGCFSMEIAERYHHLHPIIFWVLTVKDGKASLVAWDDIPSENPPLYQHHYDYTDFPEGDWKFYYQQGVVFLPSEY
jgi:hypothetical protein